MKCHFRCFKSSEELIISKYACLNSRLFFSTTKNINNTKVEGEERPNEWFKPILGNIFLLIKNLSHFNYLVGRVVVTLKQCSVCTSPGDSWSKSCGKIKLESSPTLENIFMLVCWDLQTIPVWTFSFFLFFHNFFFWTSS